MAGTKKLRVGIIGAGAIAQGCHMPGYAKDDRAELVAFAEPTVARHKEVKAGFGDLAAYRDYGKMLKEESLDVVSVCTPNRFHAAAAIAALKAGCHVLCDKPMAVNLREADRMIATAKEARKKLMVGFTHRFMSGPGKCKELLKKRRLGKPFMIRVRFAHGGPHPGWAKDPKTFYDPEIATGGAMLDMGIHAIDLCLWLFGPIVSISAKTATLAKRIAVDDNAVMLLEFKSGALGYIEAGWTSKPGFTGLELYGTEGSVICDYMSTMKLCGGRASAGADSVTEWTTLDETPSAGGWDTEIGHWLDVVTGKKKLMIDGRAGRDAVEVALAAYKSSKTGKRIQVTG